MNGGPQPCTIAAVATTVTATTESRISRARWRARRLCFWEAEGEGPELGPGGFGLRLPMLMEASRLRVVGAFRRSTLKCAGATRQRLRGDLAFAAIARRGTVTRFPSGQASERGTPHRLTPRRMEPGRAVARRSGTVGRAAPGSRFPIAGRLFFFIRIDDGLNKGMADDIRPIEHDRRHTCQPWRVARRRRPARSGSPAADQPG